MKLSPLLLAIPALLPLSLPSLAAAGDGERVVLKDSGRRKVFEIAFDEVQSVGSKSVDKLLIGKKRGLGETQKEAKILENDLGARVDLVAYEAGKPRTELHRRLVTRRVAVKLAEGVSSTLIRDTVGALASEVLAFTENRCVLTFEDSLTALNAAELLRNIDGVVSADVLLAKKMTPRKVPVDPLFGTTDPAGAGQRYVAQINDDLFGLDPVASDDSFTADNVSLPLNQNHVLTPQGSTRAYQWYLKNEGLQVPPLREEYGDRLVDINVVPAWDRVSGRGVTVAVIDDGVEMRHLDFTVANIDKNNDKNFVEKGDLLEDATPPYPNSGASMDNHGTAVAGIIFGRHDQRGIAGIAPDARMVAVRLLGGFVDELDQAQALTLGTTYIDPTPNDGVDNGVRSGRVVFDVANNSWGPASFGRDLFPEGELTHEALQYGVEKGRNNRGVVYVFASGNNGDYHDDVNHAYVSSSIYTLAVGGVTDMGRRVGYATTGAALAVVAPTQGEELPPVIVHPPRPQDGFPNGEPTNPLSTEPKNRAVDPEDVPITSRRNTQPILTFDVGGGKSGPFDRYNASFNGTSAAAPMVAGVAALVLEANPQLRWRDVHEILMRSADPVDFRSPYDGHPDLKGVKGFGRWVKGPMGNYVSHVYGFGVVNADRATRMAEIWTPTTTAWRQVTRSTGMMSRPILDYPSPGVTVQLAGPPANMRLEHVQVQVKIRHGRRGDLGITLVSPPAGQMEESIESELFVPHREDYNANFGSLDPADAGTSAEYWTFTTRRLWGARYENVQNWQVKIWDNTRDGAVNNPKAGEILVPVDNPKEPGELLGVNIIYYGSTGESENDPPVLQNDGFSAALDQPFRQRLAVKTSEKAPVERYVFRIIGPANPATTQPGPVDQIPDPDNPGEMIFPPLIDEEGYITLTPKYAGAWRVEIGAETVLGVNYRVVDFTVRAASTYPQWRQAYFTQQELQNPAISGDGADPDGDGIGNYLEFALNTDPRKFDTDVIKTTVENNAMTFTYRIDVNALGAVNGVVPETSTDLETWTPVEATDLPREGNYLPRAVTVPFEADKRVFFRLRGSNPAGSN